MNEEADPTHGFRTGQTSLWLARAKAGEEGAWNRLNARFLPRLLAFAELRIGRRLAGRTTAADIVSETWTRALKDFEKKFLSTGPGSFYRWLTTICRRVTIDEVRRMKARPDARSPAGDAERENLVSVSTPALPPWKRLELQEEVDALVRGLSELPVQERRLLIAFYVEHIPAEELSARLRCTEPALLKRIARARGRLKEIVKYDAFGKALPART